MSPHPPNDPTSHRPPRRSRRRRVADRLRRARAAVATAWREVADSVVAPVPDLVPIPIPVRARNEGPSRGGSR